MLDGTSLKLTVQAVGVVVEPEPAVDVAMAVVVAVLVEVGGCGVLVRVAVGGIGVMVGVAQKGGVNVNRSPAIAPVLQEYCVKMLVSFCTPRVPTVPVADPIVPYTTSNAA